MVALLLSWSLGQRPQPKRINEVLELDPEIKDAKKLQQPTQLRGTVEFDKVTFSYHNAESPALTNISFKNLTGKNLGNYWRHRLGQIDIGKSYSPFLWREQRSRADWWRRCARYDPSTASRQNWICATKAVLFAGTINENIRYGKSDATEKEILHAAKVAQAHEFIKQMPEGFESSISQGGTNVSGGQMQRLSIARALVKNQKFTSLTTPSQLWILKQMQNCALPSGKKSSNQLSSLWHSESVPSSTLTRLSSWMKAKLWVSAFTMT